MFNGKIPESLIEKLDSNNKLLKKNLDANKWYRVFGRGIIAGLGATIGVAIIISALAYVLNRFEFNPAIGSFIERTKVLLENDRRF
jgi:hypothetical protein